MQNLHTLKKGFYFRSTSNTYSVLWVTLIATKKTHTAPNRPAKKHNRYAYHHVFIQGYDSLESYLQLKIARNLRHESTAFATQSSEKISRFSTNFTLWPVQPHNIHEGYFTWCYLQTYFTLMQFSMLYASDTTAVDQKGQRSITINDRFRLHWINKN